MSWIVVNTMCVKSRKVETLCKHTDKEDENFEGKNHEITIFFAFYFIIESFDGAYIFHETIFSAVMRRHYLTRIALFRAHTYIYTSHGDNEHETKIPGHGSKTVYCIYVGTRVDRRIVGQLIRKLTGRLENNRL